MVELCSLTPPLPQSTLHCFISVNFMNSRWSPVFWCNNGGTSLSHPPSPNSPYIASYLSILWIPVEVPYFNVTMVELRSLIPPLPHFTLHCFISVNFMNSCWSPVFWCNNGGTLLSHPSLPHSTLHCFISVNFMNSCWSPVFWCNNGRTSLSHPPLPHFTLHCFISVNFMNSCWSPVFWCNNGGTLLSHPPPYPQSTLHCFISVNFMNSCWSPVFWCNNGGTLLSHPPPPSPNPPYIASYLSILWIPVEVPYSDVTMVELCSLIPPPLPHSTLHCFISVSFMNFCWSPVFWCYNGGTSLSHPPPFALICFIFVSILWILVEVPYFDVTMVELCSLIPPPPSPNPPYIASYLSILWIPVESRVLM